MSMVLAVCAAPVAAAAARCASSAGNKQSRRGYAAARTGANRVAAPRLSHASLRNFTGTRAERAKWELAAAETVEGATDAPPHPITMTDTALQHVLKLRDDSGGDGLCLRIGVKQGGCSGLSYLMDFEKEENVKGDDMVMEYGEHNFKLVCDPKSLLYLFGMQLDYSHELIGGGFQFQNPNAENSCGCGKSFAA